MVPLSCDSRAPSKYLARKIPFDPDARLSKPYTIKVVDEIDMSSSMGLDFGTTNTVVAFGQPDGTVETARFRYGDEEFSAFRSALSFWRHEIDGRSQTRHEAGPWAIENFLDSPTDTRFFQSFKTYAASSSFQHTSICGKRYRFEDILAAFFERIRSHAEDKLGALPPRLVLGRPVNFAGLRPDALLARHRYESAFRRFGFQEIHHVMEPVAAAYFYAQQLKSDATVLVGDFGGGTSDFSIVRLERSALGVQACPVSHSGVGVAGDMFDYRIIDAVVAPLLGKGSKYKSWGKILEVPSSAYHSFARWNDLCLMRSPETVRDLKQLAAASLEPEKLRKFISLIEGAAAYTLYKSVSEAKTRLSFADSARFEFTAPGIHIDATLYRDEFETWIRADLDRIGSCVDRALGMAALEPSRIDRVFLTGGTSFVPAVRRIFEERFGSSKIDLGNEFVSIAHGLALIAGDENIDRWIVKDN